MSRKRNRAAFKKAGPSFTPAVSITSSEKLSIWQKILPPSVLTILTVLSYYPSLNYPFQFDDLANITKKYAIRFDVIIGSLTRGRWMSDWLNRKNYEWGQFAPFIYRVTNLMIHLLAGLLLFYLILDLCRFLKTKPFFYNNATLIAFTTAALFLLHPVQTQTVSYVIQGRLEGLATLFIIAILFLFARAFHVKNSIVKYCLLALSFLLIFPAYGTKEIVIAIPFLVILIDWFFISQEKWEDFKKRFLWYAVAGAIFFVVLFTFYLSTDYITRALTLKMSTPNNRGNVLTDQAYDIITPLHFLISEFKVILHYLAIFVWPFGISVEYDWKLASSFFAPDSFFPFLALIAIFALTIYTLVKKKNTFIAFGLIWFFISIAPRASIIPSPELICDYKTYLASIGWIFVLAVALVYFIKFAMKKIKNVPAYVQNYNYQLAIFTILMLPFVLGTVTRNTVWRTATEFWGDIVKKAPGKARGHNNYGVALCENNRIDEAIAQYREAVKLDRHYADPLSNIAVAYSLKNDIDSAITALRGAINIFPNYPEAYNNLGTLLLKKKDYAAAEESLKYAIQIRPYYGKAFYNLGRLYFEQGNEEIAWEYFKKATTGDLDTTEGFFTLGQISIKLKKYDEAVDAFENILKLNTPIEKPQHNQIMFNLANAYYMQKKLDHAESIYEKLADENPLDSRYLFNLAETVFNKGDANKAIALFKKVTTMPQPLGQAHFRIAACLEKLDKVKEAKDYLNDIMKTKAPEQFKQMAKRELARIEMQEKIKEGNGSIKMSDAQKILDKAKPEKEISKDKKTA